ncbi:MAG: 50S ribosomal protein L10 [Schleiferiaceae bacterium]|jgi:large subunit ribosomal protein L10
MTREEKNQAIQELTELLEGSNTVYIADIAGLNAVDTSNLRRAAFSKQIKLSVVKNTLLKKAMEASSKDFEELYPTLVGNTSIMIAEAGNAPAKLIKDFRKKVEKPILKGAFIEESIYIGDDQLESLTQIKSKEELIGDVITLLQSPAKNVISALQGGGSQKLAGLVKALEERA